MPVIARIKLTSKRTSQLIAYKAVEKMVLDMQGGVKVSANVETETSVLERKKDGASLHLMVKFFVGQLEYNHYPTVKFQKHWANAWMPPI